MFRDLATATRPGLFRRLATMLGRWSDDKQTVSCSLDRMSALNDPATRRALAKLPPHLLRDVGTVDQGRHEPATDTPEGEALRRHMW